MTLMKIKNKELPYDKNLNNMMFTLFKALSGCLDPDGLQEPTDTYTAKPTDFVIKNTGQSKNVVIPAAAAANKGKVFLIRLSNGTARGNVVDDAASPNTIISEPAAADLYLLSSTGDITTHSGAYVRGWHVIKLK